MITNSPADQWTDTNDQDFSGEDAGVGEMRELIKATVSAYYTDKIKQHGPTAQGVDWNSIESQELRFWQLTRIIDRDPGFSLNDYGCGYGALVPFLASRFSSFEYCGFDWSKSMIEEANRLYSDRSRCRFVAENELMQPADYTIASGIFNVKLGHRDADWQRYILDVLHKLDTLSTGGFSFNILTSYSDPERQRGDLFYGDPCFFFDYCKRQFSRNVALLHDYGLYEFTVLVRKQS